MDDAESYFRTAIVIEPTYPEAYDNLGIVLRQGTSKRSPIPDGREADLATHAHNNLGISLAAQGDLARSPSSAKRSG